MVSKRSATRAEADGEMRYGRLQDLLKLAVKLAGTAEGLRLSDIQSEFGVSRRTAERRRDALRGAFPDIKAESDGRERLWRLPRMLGHHLADPSAAELSELEAAARRLREEGAAPERAALLEGLTGKLHAAMRQDARRRSAPDIELLMEAEGTLIRPGPRPVLPSGLLPLLREAILACREVRFAYCRTDAVAAAERTVQPLGLLHGPRPYLVASVLGTPGDPTLFRLDRMSNAEMLEQAFVRDAKFSLADYASRSFGVYQEEPFQVRLRFAADVAEEVKQFHFHPTQEIQALPDGAVEVRFFAGGELEMVHHLATWEDVVEVLKPESLRQELVDWATHVARHHRRATRRAKD